MRDELKLSLKPARLLDKKFKFQLQRKELNKTIEKLNTAQCKRVLGFKIWLE